MSNRFYRWLTFSLLITALLISSLIFSYGSLIVPASLILIFLVALTITAAVFGMKADNKLGTTLKEAMGKVAAGELGGRLPVKTNDEWGRIYQAFNEMSVNLDWMVSRLSEDRRRLQTILSTMTDGVIMTDKDGNVILANPAAERFFGFKREQCPGCPLIQIISDHEVNILLTQCIKEEKQQSIQFESRQAKQFFQIYAYPLFTERLTGVLLLFQDLTEVRNLQSVRREFIANVSHEFKTPLAAIKAIVETLEDGAVNEKEVARDFLGKIDDEVDAMIKMVNELIELSRIEMGKAELKIEPVNLNALVRETITRLAPIAERAQLSITSEPTLGLPPVPADKEMVGEVITNIIQNAIKFTPSGGKIKVYTRLEGDFTEVSIADNGIGIGPDDLPHIFERFYKADKSRNTNGTGLGMAIARHIIQVHGGRIRVESEPGKGSRFTFTLPVSPVAEKLIKP